MTHTHKADQIRTLPFVGADLSTCKCGAMQRSDGKPITGGYEQNGWYLPTPPPRDAAYRLLQSEGYTAGPALRDPADEFDVPGAQ